MDKVAIESKNSELLLASIREDIANAAKELTEIYKKRDEGLGQINHIQGTILEMELGLKEKQDRLKEEKEQFKAEKEQWEAKKKEGQNEVFALKKKIKEAVKELAWVNEKIMKGEEDAKEYEKLSERYTDLILKCDSTSQKISDLEVQKESLESKVNTLRIEHSEGIDKYNQSLNEITKQVEKLKKEAQEAVEKRDQADQEYTRIQNEAARKERDLQIYINRVEALYNKAFPELRMKL